MPNKEDSPEVSELKDKINNNFFGDSEKFSDSTITNHNRFRYLSKNTRERRGRKVEIT